MRAHAAHALGEIGSPAKPAVPALADLVKDPDETVRRQAVRAVLHIRPGPQVTIPLCVKLLRGFGPGGAGPHPQRDFRVGPPAVPGLIAALKNDKAAYWACLVLRDMGPAAKDAVPALTEKLQDPLPEIRREAILALAAMEEAAGCGSSANRRGLGRRTHLPGGHLRAGSHRPDSGRRRGDHPPERP